MNVNRKGTRNLQAQRVALLRACAKAGGRLVGLARVNAICCEQALGPLVRSGRVVEERVEGDDCEMDVAVTLTAKGREWMDGLGLDLDGEVAA